MVQDLLARLGTIVPSRWTAVVLAYYLAVRFAEAREADGLVASCQAFLEEVTDDVR